MTLALADGVGEAAFTRAKSTRVFVGFEGVSIMMTADAAALLGALLQRRRILARIDAVDEAFGSDAEIAERLRSASVSVPP